MKHETIVYCDAQGENVFVSTCKKCETLKRQELSADEFKKCMFYGEP